LVIRLPLKSTYKNYILTLIEKTRTKLGSKCSGPGGLVSVPAAGA
jgi:hypothetical protein